MKIALFLVGLVISTAMQAQRNQDTTPYITKIPKAYVKPAPCMLPGARLTQVLPNGSKVYALPQDNMPCVAPTLQGYTIPNAGDSSLLLSPSAPGRMPAGTNAKVIVYTETVLPAHR